MGLYHFLVLVHVIAAIVGIGATFALPAIANKPKTPAQAQFTFGILARIEKIAKIGSITLLLTGLILGFLEPKLFKEFWYIASIVIYIAVQPIVAGILPKKIKQQKQILEAHTGDGLPEAYLTIARQMDRLNQITHAAAIILIILMVVKPF
ncbi:DUF2269 domain-containing protein [Neobacillus piezotolerans]|uniref:DUF2269 domain-containing protein n=1 Tax=Neobacillus piezotolerans TaxID=2259171 RepID=A0A3D8GS29_9BACI|nr:DUF2269 family protein [Neobacillus piezotolerans]RDU37019.1 DUF2269 domain-containing protein [Neobacillus piezotolerans]